MVLDEKCLKNGEENTILYLFQPKVIKNLTNRDLDFF